MNGTIALDVGDKTVGVAASDELGITAQGVTTVRRTDDAEDLRRLGEIFAEYGAQTVVVGLPKNMNGTEGERCRIVREFAAVLGERFPAVAMVFQDERLSTVAAERPLKEAGQRRKKRKKTVDKLAATIILQTYLDKVNMTNKSREVTEDDRGNF